MTDDRSTPAADDRSTPAAGDRSTPGVGDCSTPGAGDGAATDAGPAGDRTGDRAVADGGRAVGPRAGALPTGASGGDRASAPVDAPAGAEGTGDVPAGVTAGDREDAGGRSRGLPSPRATLAALDRVAYALFSGRADDRRHDADRDVYRGTDLRVSFPAYLARVYAASWVAFAVGALAAGSLTAAVPDRTIAAAGRLVYGVVPALAGLPVPALPRPVVALPAAVAAGAVCKRLAVGLGGRYLRWRARARRVEIRRTLPGAVRYLRALSTGGVDRREMLRKVARNEDAYGATAAAFRKALNDAAATGNLDDGLRLVARDTPSREALAPFLLKFAEHADQGDDALRSYLRMEARMLGHRQDRARDRAEGFLELLAEVFVVLLILPSLSIIVLTVVGVLAPGLSEPVHTPLGSPSVRAVVVYASAAFVLAVGGAGSLLIATLRPPDQSTPARARPGGVETLLTAARNPASAAVVVAPVAVAVAVALLAAGHRPVNAVLLGYVAFGLPVGAVAVRRARIDDAKDREIEDFVHAVSGHVNLGRPFPEAVRAVARDVDLGPLAPDVADLAFNANLTTGVPDREGDSRGGGDGRGRGPAGRPGDAGRGSDPGVGPGPAGAGGGRLQQAALDRFVDRVGTPMAEQTIGLVTGALEAGGNAADVFDTLQAEVGRLYHEKKALRSSMVVYAAVGWTTALIVISIAVAVNVHIVEGFARAAAQRAGEAGTRTAIAPGAIDPARERFRFYLVTQATMVACGWFAGTASRGRYEALLHSAALVLVAYAVFVGAGMV